MTPGEEEPREEEPIPSRELEARYKALVGDEPNPAVSGMKRMVIILAACFLSAIFIALCRK